MMKILDKLHFEPKDYVAVMFSSLALTLSFTTLYVNTLRIKESVVFIDHFEPIPDKREKLLVIDKDRTGEISFVNTGNQPIVISRLDLMYAQPKVDEPPACPEHESVVLKTDMKPTVIKPNDVFIDTYKIESSVIYVEGAPQANRNVSRGLEFSIKEFSQDKKMIRLDICVNIFFFTPSTRIQSKLVPVMRVEAEKGGWFYPDQDGEGPLQRAPVYLIDTTKALF